MSQEEKNEYVLAFEKVLSRFLADAMKRKAEGVETKYHLTTDQYKIMSAAAQKLCVTAHQEDNYCSYLYVNSLADYTSMVTGIYPERDILKVAWYIACESNGKGDKKDVHLLLGLLLGPFSYDEDCPSEDEGKEVQKFTEAQIAFLKAVKGSSDPIAWGKIMESRRDELTYIGPSKLDTGRWF